MPSPPGGQKGGDMRWKVRIGPLGGALWAVVVIVVGLAFAASPAAAATVTFSFTGSAQSWTVPSGVTSASFDVFGAQGADGSSGPDFGPGGLGGRATVTVAVSPGQTFDVNVGGAGSGVTGGFDGGGNGGLFGGSFGGGGGGASDVRTGAFGLSDRVVVAGGGAGGGNSRSFNPLALSFGGAGGGAVGGDGGGVGNSPSPGMGGTPTMGGMGGAGAGDGVFGAGGAGACSSGFCGGGGGGGWWGGGGGTFGGGGGGSGFGPAGVSFQTGVRSGAGQVLITFTTAAQAITDLQAQVSGLGLPKGLTTALNSKLQDALDDLAADDTAGACGSLQAFLNQVKAQTAKKLNSAQAEQLTDSANAIRTLLDC
jgi:hypothetical protein